jgi:hypothetical protein
MLPSPGFLLGICDGLQRRDEYGSERFATDEAFAVYLLFLWHSDRRNHLFNPLQVALV